MVKSLTKRWRHKLSKKFDVIIEVEGGIANVTYHKGLNVLIRDIDCSPDFPVIYSLYEDRKTKEN